MSHSSTELLIDYWQTLVVNGQIPARTAIDPADFATLLPQVFILGRTSPGAWSFRLAGGLLRDLHDRDLRSADFARLWSVADRIAVQTVLERGRRVAEPIRLRAEALAGPHAATLRVTLLPLTGEGGEANRFLGLYEALTPLGRLRGLPVDTMQLSQLEAVEGGPHYLRLAAMDGRRVG